MTRAELIDFLHTVPPLVSAALTYIDNDEALDEILVDMRAAAQQIEADDESLPFTMLANTVRRTRLAALATPACPASARRAAALRQVEDELLRLRDQAAHTQPRGR